ncbi:uncharacterized protein LOC130713127 [Lotus japonicus]|uniref:uncharacterized protein LOC130713127 n=1 Tax=Lotus japonicus TaxID=34305 RepID=UPI00258A2051|nr:uncharacterized protein LOC130713127 [Lotus japonicus]
MVDDYMNDTSAEYYFRMVQESQQQFDDIVRRRRNVIERYREEEALGNLDNYFQMRVDVIRKKGLSPLQNCTVAIRMLTYGSPADNLDEYVRIGESTAIECL